MTEYLRVSGMYWGLTVMDLMASLELMQKEDVLDFVHQCQHECGGVGASCGHDAHLLYTLSAVQVRTHQGQSEQDCLTFRECSMFSTG